MLRLADGPDEVHKVVLARLELNRWAKRAEAEAAGGTRPEAGETRDFDPEPSAALVVRLAGPDTHTDRLDIEAGALKGSSQSPEKSLLVRLHN